MKVKMSDFRRLNIVDLVGMGVFFLVLATAVFFFLRRASYVTIKLRISQADSLTSYGLPIWYFDSLKAGMVQKDFFGRPVISLLKTYSNPNNVSNRILYLTMDVLTVYDKRSKGYSYEGSPLFIGSYQTFKFNGMLIRGVVIKLANASDKPEVKMYEVEGFLNPEIILNQNPYSANTVTDGVKTYIAERFSRGLEIKDNDHEVVAKVKDVTIGTAYRSFIAGSQIIKTVDTERKKVSLRLLLKTVKVGDIFLYMEDIPIKINSNLDLDFPDLSVPLTITGFKEI